MKNDYVVPGDYGINAYTDEAAEGKRRFLNDGMKLAKAVGRELQQHDWVSHARRNQGGIAVSGEVYADLIPPDGNYQFLLEVGTTSMRGGFMSERQSDGALLMLQRWTRTQDGRRGSIDGDNWYMDINSTPAEIAAVVLKWAQS